jgi:hypothetical protein
MFTLTVPHLKATGELLEMPPKPLFPDPAWSKKYGQKLVFSPNGKDVSSPIFGGLSAWGDQPAKREFVLLTPKNPTAMIDLRGEALEGFIPAATRYFHTGPEQLITRVDMEVRYQGMPTVKGLSLLNVQGDLMAGGAVNPTGLTLGSAYLPKPAHTVALNVRGVTGVSLVSWKVTAHFCPPDPPLGTLILRGPEDISFYASLLPPDDKGLIQRPRDPSTFAFRMLEGKPLPDVRGTSIQQIPAGDYTLSFGPQVYGPWRTEKVPFKLAAGETVEIALSARLDPRMRREVMIGPYHTGAISIEYEQCRLGASMGDTIGMYPGEVCFYEDHSGRWLVLWTMRRDLYMMISTDRGRTWSPTTKLPAPVNSAHDERYPVLSQDASGRYLLGFSSDRNLAHAHSVYVCWSDDL